MSRFFASSLPDSDSEASSDESDELQTVGSTAAHRMRLTKEALSSLSDSSDEETTRRVVRSLRDKRYTELKDILINIRDAKEAGEWTTVSFDFDRLCKQIQKSATVLEKEGAPKFLVKFLSDLEVIIKKTLENKDQVKKMSTMNAKSLNIMRQKICKLNKLYETEIERYHQNPESYIHDDFLEKKSDSFKDEANAVGRTPVTVNRVSTKEKIGDIELESSSSIESRSSEELKDEESSSWSSETESEVLEESEPEEGAGIERWLKKDTTVSEKMDAVGKKQRKVRKAREKKLSEVDYEAKDYMMGIKDTRLFEITPENVDKRLKEVQETRGKRGFDRYEVITVLRRLLELVRGNNLKTARILTTLIPIQYEYNVASTSYLNTEIWKNVESDINLLLDILFSNPSFAIREEVESVAMASILETTSADGSGGGETFTPIYVGNIVNFVERLDDEFTKSLQNIDPHTTEYVDRLRDETSLYRLLIRAKQYFEKSDHLIGVWRVTLRILEHMYYKHDDLIRKVHSMIDSPSDKSLNENPSTLLDRFCTQLYTANDDRIRTRAMLCHIYHHALHDRYFVARDLMLLSHLQETIQNADISTQILFNRTMVQMGLCAFRLGMIRECQTSLQDIHFSGRVKELLAQGFMPSKYADKNPDMERVERQRQVPFHMHINIELLECIFLVSSMLMEIPNIASNPHDSKAKIISRAYRRTFDYSERQIFVGPPENTRDYIMAASKALLVANWRKCRDLILGIKIWSLIPNIEKIYEMLTREIQEQGLRTFLFSYHNYYDSLSVQNLSEMFELSPSTVQAIVSRLIINEELHAVMDQNSEIILFYHDVEPTRLQYLALQLTEKVIRSILI
jgi:translation initiation factor 3 subunit C